jgi:hypothetical protein
MRDMLVLFVQFFPQQTTDPFAYALQKVGEPPKEPSPRKMM